jgi:tetratricopeptide (TPR) repeat protein
MASRGVNGVTVAAALLDGLVQMQKDTRSSSAALAATGAWTRDIKFAIPETGLSVGEIYGAVRQRFGHDVYIGGDLVEYSTGRLELTVRGNGVPAKKFAGAPDELAELISHAAEHVYSYSQPARWVTYLSDRGRDAEVAKFCQETLANQDDETRARLLNVWAIASQNLGRPAAESMSLLESAIKLKPDLWPADTKVMNALIVEGREEEAWRYSKQLEKTAGGRPGNVPELYFDNLDQMTWNINAIVDALKHDEASSGAGTQQSTAANYLAQMYLLLHDQLAVETELRSIKEDSKDRSAAAGVHFVRGRLAFEEGDQERALVEMRKFNEASEDRRVFSDFPTEHCWLGVIEEATGHPDRADTIFADGRRFVDCARFRADALDHRDDWVGALAVYASAVELAPDLPAPYYSWGLALLRHGGKRGPHWAEPLKALGDLLAKRRERKVARAKYEAALAEAPNWRDLHEAIERLNQATP